VDEILEGYVVGDKVDVKDSITVGSGDSVERGNIEDTIEREKLLVLK